MAQQTTIADVIQAKKKFYSSCLNHLQQSFTATLDRFLENGPEEFAWQVKYNNIPMDETGKTYNLLHVNLCIKIFLTELKNKEQSFIKDFKIDIAADTYICKITIDFDKLAQQFMQ